MNIVVIGAGSLGMLLTAKLASYCKRIELVTRTQAQADALLAEGIQVKDQIDERNLQPNPEFIISSYENPAYDNRLADVPDYVLLTVKQFAIDDSFIRNVAARLGKTSKLICFQNGTGHVERLITQISSDQIYLAITTEGAKRISATTVQHTGHGITYMGPSKPNSAPSEIKDLCNLLKSAGFRAETSNRIITKVWNKLVINSVINPLTAILRVKNGQLIQSEHSIQVMRNLYAEALKVAQAESISLSEDLWEQIVEVCERTAANHSSMLQDVLAGRSTEINWINGALLTIGDKHHLALPVNQTVYHLVKTMDTS
ncbi:ketopantoate reductase family protein [Paenibacillus albiflavus]|nr:2-dehydropantoate 2-reductase [Paenibacillus albiflavus]